MAKPIVEGRPSLIHGTGCFACVDLPAGTWIPVPSYPTEEQHLHDVYMDEDMGWHRPHPPFCFVNHNTYGNCSMESADGHIFLVIEESVIADTELTMDYGEDWEKEDV